VSPPGTEAPPAGPAPFAYRPALDGLRGVAVGAVLAFHLGLGWAKGGFLGVSVFFTLSGYLITTLLVREKQRSGRIDLKRFWSRRLRRLAPAALLGIVLAAITARWIAAPSGSQLDMVAAGLNLANWRFVVAGHSYAALFASPSPVLHYWSLAIEEQFYLVFPVVALVAMRGRRRPRRLLRWCVLGTLVSWSVLTVCGLGGWDDFAYYATITRAGELLAGAVAAIAVRRVAGPAPRWWQAAAVAALVGLGALVHGITASSPWLERGALPLTAVLSAIVISVACAGGLVATGLAWRPLVGMGRVSYGVYVYHWPLFLLLTTARTGLSGPSLIAVRLAATFAVAGVSYVFVEQPIREGRWPTSRAALRVAPIAYASVAVVILFVGSTPAPVNFDTAQRQLAMAASAAPVVATPRPTPRVAVFGDSTALMMALGLASWATNTGQLRYVGGVTELGCSITRGGERRYQGLDSETTPKCDDWPNTWTQQLTTAPADIAIVLEGPWEVADRKLAGDDQWRHLGDPVLDDNLHTEVLAAVDLLLQHVQTVVLMTSPDIQGERAVPNPPAAGFPESDPQRMAIYNDTLRRIASERPHVRIVDLNAHLASLPGGEMDPNLRSDGIHFDQSTTGLVADWIGQATLRAFEQQ
jgi:peptidoglycan/LPS O-acetylase OafA/YrhL